MVLSYVRELLARRRARKAAELVCRTLRPRDSVHGSWICADESARYVVRVFCGERGVVGLPPWRECLLFSVEKGSNAVELIVEDSTYRPVIGPDNSGATP